MKILFSIVSGSNALLLFLFASFHSTHSAELLVAYVGFLNGPSLGFAAVSGCNPQVQFTADGMALTFDVQVDTDTIVPDQFAITVDEKVLYPTCATLEPAAGADEGHTVLVVGNYLSGDGESPSKIEIVVSSSTGKALKSVDGEDLTGLTAKEIRYGPTANGVRLALAYWYPAWGDYGQVQVVWEGGVSAEGGDEVGDEQLQHYWLVDKNGQKVNPTSFGDLDDNDNYQLLNLPADFDGMPVKVEVDAGTVFDPQNYPSAATSVDVRESSYEGKSSSFHANLIVAAVVPITIVLMTIVFA